MKKVMLVFGTRPEAIKMAPLVKEFQKFPEQFKTIVCVTGQHREMLDQVLHLFEITPDYDLNIMKQGQDLYDVTARVLVGMRDVLKEAQPDVVLVHGDTTTSNLIRVACEKKMPLGDAVNRKLMRDFRLYMLIGGMPQAINEYLATNNFRMVDEVKRDINEPICVGY